MNSIAEVPLAASNAGEVAHNHGGYTTAHIVTRLFPQPTLGQIFFERFVECAQSNRDVLPDEPESSAIIHCDSIALLGKELGLSNDTTHKYVTLYIALGLLTKRKILGRLYFVLALGIYHAPETLAANLDYHIAHSTTRKSRNKFHQLFVDVKERCLVYGFIPSDFPQTLTRLNAMLEPEKGESRIRLERRFQQAQHLLSTLTATFFAVLSPHTTTQVDSLHTFPTSTTPSSTRITSRVDSVLQDRTQKSTHIHIPERVVDASSSATLQKNLPDFTAPVDPSRRHMTENLPDLTAPVDVQREVSRKNLPAHSIKVDAESIQQIVASTLMPHSGRREEMPSPENLPGTHSQVDVQATLNVSASTSDDSTGRRERGVSANLPIQSVNVEAKNVEKSTLSTISGRRIVESAPKNLPETSTEVDSSEPIRNVNVYSIYNYITFTLRNADALAKFFAVELESDESVFPKYRKLFHRDNNHPRSAHQLAAAFICTQFQRYSANWSMRSPGAYFTRRCRDYDTGIPEDVEEMIRVYGSLSVSQLIEKLTQEAQARQQANQEHEHWKQASKLERKSGSEPVASPLQLLPSTKVERSRATMSLEEADQLVNIIIDTPVDKNHARIFRAARVRVGKENPHYVVLVDAALTGSYRLQRIVYSAQEWQQQLAMGNTARLILSSKLEHTQNKE